MHKLITREIAISIQRKQNKEITTRAKRSRIQNTGERKMELSIKINLFVPMSRG